MAFKDFARKAAGAAQAMGDIMQQKAELINRYKDRYSGLSDEELMRKYKSTTGEERAACRVLLEERGYGN